MDDNTTNNELEVSENPNIPESTPESVSCSAPDSANQTYNYNVPHSTETASQSETAPTPQSIENNSSQSQINQIANTRENTQPPYGSQTYTGYTGYSGYTQPSYSNSYTKADYAAATENPTYTHMFSDGKPVKRKKDKKSKAKLGAGGIVLCIVLSLIFGFGGASAALYLLPLTGSNPLGGGVVINTVDSATSSIGTITTLNDVVEKTLPSVVEVTTEEVVNDGFFGQYVTQGAGSGVIISSDGYIATNNHVVENGKTITVSINGESYAATLIGTDVQTDIAVIKIECENLTPAIFGNISEVKIGDSVIAIGNPLGTLGGSVTDGIISALEREVTIDGQKMTLLQTNAQVNPGNSGGGLFNMKGELIGIVNSKSGSSTDGVSIEGIGFAIPIDRVKQISTNLIENGYVSGRLALGVQVLAIETIADAQKYGLSRTGVYVVSVDEGYGAEKAGIQAEDYILSVDGQLVDNVDDISAILQNHTAGDEIEIQVVRENRIVDLQVELKERK